MKLLICVPSKGRAEIFSKKTLKVLRCTKVPWKVFVEPQEVKVYSDKVGSEAVVQLGASNQGLGYSLDSIRKYCLTNEIQYCWKMDDDIHHWYDGSRVQSKESQGKMLEAIQDMLSTAESLLGDKFAGFSFASNYFHKDWRMFTHFDKMFETTYVVKTSVWFTPLEFRGYHEEFIASVWLYLQGLKTLRVGTYCWNADLSCYPGGLQSFNREKEQAEFFDLLIKIYPNLVGFTKRKEYLQKTGKMFTVTDKSVFNKVCSTPIKGNL